jgi:hypothetical protein
MCVSLRVSLAVAAAVWALPAGAQHYDLSQPMSGTSQYVFGIDGKPVALGATPVAAPVVAAKPKEEAAPAWGGSVPVQTPAAAGPAARVVREPAARRAGGTLVVVGGGSAGQQAAAKPQAVEKAEPKRKTSGCRIGRRGRR